MVWDIFREMDHLRREIDSAFRGFGRGTALEPSFLPGLGVSRYPQMNMQDDRDHLYIEALVPGMDPKGLELTVMINTLTLSGERREVEGEKTWHRNERGSGRFLRTIELPVEVDSEQVQAECKNGLLTITLPKAEKARPRKITVQAQ